MGNKTSNGSVKDTSTKTQPIAAPTKSSFDFLYIIGKGGFGKVLINNLGMESLS
jgi:hypothetical protein